jgi:hypothetical protein
MVLKLPLNKLQSLISKMKGIFIDLDTDYQLSNSFALCLFKEDPNYAQLPNAYYVVYLLDLRTLSLINYYKMEAPRELRSIMAESYGIYLETNLYDSNGLVIDEFLSYRIFSSYSDKGTYSLHIRQLFTKIGLLCELEKVDTCISKWEPERVSVIDEMVDDLKDEIKTMLKNYP